MGFVAALGIGLEGANLDHTARFAERFRAVGDEAGAALQERICAEEVPHVRFAASWFARWRAMEAPSFTRLGRRAAAAALAALDARRSGQPRGAPPRRALAGVRRRAHAMVAWLLNFDAEAELADPSAQTSKRAVLARWPALTAQVAALFAAGDVVIAPGTRASGHAGCAWCPTPRALAAISRAGARVPAAPPIEVIRRVNHRRFCAELGQTLPHARYVTTSAELNATLAAGTGIWLLKRPFGFAGRGRLRVAAAAITEPAAARWIEASLTAGEGLQVEPWVDRAGDFALHGHLSETGLLTLGEPTAQRCDAGGAWVASARAAPGDLTGDERAALQRAAEDAAAALAAAGYFGPFGVDAFRFRDAGGASRWNPRCEINARYSMGWAVGMGDRRPD